MANILIAGASSGIGKALAKRLVTDGHGVTATFHTNEPDLHHDRLSWHQLNVLDSQPDYSWMPESLDGLVYSPGAINLKPFARVKPEEFQRDFDLQVIGAIKTIQAALPSLKKSGAGSVVLFSTVAVQSGFGFHSIVSSSKGAIEGLARSLAAELAPVIRVNVVAPSLTDTPLAAQLLGNEERRQASAQRHPLKRVGLPGDPAAAARFLISPESSWITGQVLHVDGGMGALR